MPFIFREKRFQIPRHAPARFQKLAGQVQIEKHVAGCYDGQELSVMCVICDDQQNDLKEPTAAEGSGQIEVAFFFWQRIDQQRQAAAHLRHESNTVDFHPIPEVVDVNHKQITINTGMIASKNWRDPHRRWVRFQVNSKHSTAVETQRLTLRVNEGEAGTDPEDYLNLRTRTRRDENSDSANKATENDKSRGSSPSFHNTVVVPMPGSGPVETVMGNKNTGHRLSARDISAPTSQISADKIEGSFNIENSFNSTVDVLKKRGQDELANAIAQLKSQVIDLKSSSDADNVRKVDKHSGNLLKEIADADPEEGTLHASANGLIKAAKCVAGMAPPIIATVTLILKFLGYHLPAE